MDPLAIIIVVAQLSAALALFNGFLTTIGQSRIAVAAIESIARQPEAAGNVRSTMIISLAMAETSGIYGLLISFLLLFANPLVQIFLTHMM
ncbi:MAG: ATP synthase F0 subunit C [Oscillospiraceae bacterium]|nr:ATP synthase F0 subunit C [Oscillospiraceae bacterium]